MTTKKQALSGRPTANNQAAQAASAERRRCPKCDRKSALRTITDDWGYGPVVIRHCRFCGYETSTVTE